MAKFECLVYELKVMKHPDPEVERIELGQVGDYLSVIPKGVYNSGDRIVYIPESSVVPPNILKELNLEGKLAGSKKNRVKAIKLRGVLSQGIIYPAKANWVVGQDVAEILGITKYEPPIPTAMSGEVNSWGLKVKFDIENIKKYPQILKEGELVVYTEKIHGTCTIMSLAPSNYRKEDMVEGKYAVSSKGLAERQLYFKDVEKNKDNIYLKALNSNVRKLMESFNSDNLISVFGETFGKVQDLKYGKNQGVDFRAFGIKVGKSFLNYNEFEDLCSKFNIPTVPKVYEGPHSKEALEIHTKGKEQVSGNEAHLREGVVIYPQKEREDIEIGRVILKSVSDNYLTRKGGTEFN